MYSKQIPKTIITNTSLTTITWNVQEFDNLKGMKMFNIIPELLYDKLKVFSYDYLFL